MANRQSFTQLLLGALLSVVVSQPLGAQSYQCNLPRSVAVPQIERDGPVRQMPASGYIFALSWSPEFCRTRERSRAHARQCSGRAGSFGLIVHGLWPQAGRTWPQWCPAPRRPTRAELARQMCVSPSARLAARQWAKHGSCMTQRPASYFRATRILFSSLDMPDLDRLSRKEGLTAGDIREAWIIANTNWKREMIAVQLNERGWLRELRLCYGRDFLPAPCPRTRRGAPDSAPAKIWRGL